MLKVLGGGNCFRDISGFCRMNRQTAESSFHHFCEKFSEGLWESWLYLPVGEELQKVEEIYRKCGYPGAMGSVGCTHFKWEATPFSERTIHQGKEGYTTVVVEATCDHAGRIIAATKSYPGAENDKTVIARMSLSGESVAKRYGKVIRTSCATRMAPEPTTLAPGSPSTGGTRK